MSCNEGDYACNCQGEQEWSWKWGGGWFPTMDTTVAASDGLEEEYCERDTRAWGERVDGWLKGQYWVSTMGLWSITKMSPITYYDYDP